MEYEDLVLWAEEQSMFDCLSQLSLGVSYCFVVIKTPCVILSAVSLWTNAWSQLLPVVVVLLVDVGCIKDLFNSVCGDT